MFLFIKLDPIFKYCSTAFSSRISIPSLPFDLQIVITPVISRQFTIHSGPRCSSDFTGHLQADRVFYVQLFFYSKLSYSPCMLESKPSICSYHSYYHLDTSRKPLIPLCMGLFFDLSNASVRPPFCREYWSHSLSFSIITRSRAHEKRASPFLVGFTPPKNNETAGNTSCVRRLF